jgi:hypothetical protein
MPFTLCHYFSRLNSHLFLLSFVPFDRYAEVTYGNLKDKSNGINQESEVVANSLHNLADVIYRQRGHLIKAEAHAREAIRIRTKKNGNDHNDVGVSCLLLANILMVQGKLGISMLTLLLIPLAGLHFCIGLNFVTPSL